MAMSEGGAAILGGLGKGLERASGTILQAMMNQQQIDTRNKYLDVVSQRSGYGNVMKAIKQLMETESKGALRPTASPAAAQPRAQPTASPVSFPMAKPAMGPTALDGSFLSNMAPSTPNAEPGGGDASPADLVGGSHNPVSWEEITGS